jgi:hypothetical protein
MRGRGGLLLAPSLVLLVLAFAIPVGMLVPTSFRPYVPLVGITSGFTVRYYTKLVTDSYYLEIIGRTLGLGLTVTALTLVIGYPVAFFLARTRSRWRGWLTILVVFPLLLNLVVRTFGWIALLAYPRLYGAWLLWAWLIRCLWLDRRARVANAGQLPSDLSHEPAVARRMGPHSQCRGASMAKQFVVELKNEPGAMATLAEALAARGVDLRAIGGGSIGDSGHVIMTTADDDTAKAVLDEKGYNYIEGESILAEVDDRPGGMARLARSLADANVNIYGHLFLGRWGDRATFAFVVDDPETARPILERKD